MATHTVEQIIKEAEQTLVDPNASPESRAAALGLLWTESWVPALQEANKKEFDTTLDLLQATANSI